MKVLSQLLITLLVALTNVAVAQAPATIDQATLTKRLETKDANLLVLDVRTPEEFAAGHVPGAKNIPHDQLPARLSELAGAKDKDLVVYCRSGRRTAIALDTLAKNGFTRAKHLEGDMLKWEENKLPIEK